MQHHHLFQPTNIKNLGIAGPSTESNKKGIQCKNRVVMAPLTRCRSGENRTPNEQMANYYQQRCSAGLIIAEATLIDPMGAGMLNTPGIYNEQQIENWKLTTDAVHAHDGKIVLQLWHCGRSSHSDFLNDHAPLAPSPIAIKGKEVHTRSGKKPCGAPRELEIAEISTIAKQYAVAARNAMQAGFDGVELHGANGYLIDQFLQSKTNHRTDRYGGSIANRCRFLLEILEETSRYVSPDKIGLRLSPNGNFNDMGSSDFRETFQYVLKRFNDFEGAFVHIMDGLDFGFHDLGNPVTLSEGRQLFHGTLIGNCGYSAEQAEQRIAEGDADMIAFGRPFITNPDYPLRIKNGWPLAEPTPRESWYTHNGPGYDDHPHYSEQSGI